MPDLVSIANDLKMAPDQWLVHQSQSPSGATPPYLVLAELQRRQLLRGGQAKPPSSSVAQDTVAATLKQIAPPSPSGPPPPPGMTPPGKGMPTGEPGGPVPGARPPQNMGPPQGMRRGGPVRFGEGGDVDDDEEEPSYLDQLQLRQMPPQDLIRYFSKIHNIDPRIPLAIAGNETDNFDPKAVSRKGAAGIMQLMPDTAREMGVRDIFDPVQNIEGGVKYAKKMHTMFKGNLPFTFAGYNAGPGSVKKYHGVPPFRETQEYVQKGMGQLRQPTAAMAANPFPEGRYELMDSPQGPAEPPPDVPASAAAPAPGPAPELPASFAAPPPPNGLAATAEGAAAGPAWQAPESEELQFARRQMKESRESYDQFSRDAPERTRSSINTLREKAPDDSRLAEAIAELTQQSERDLHPSIGQTLRNLGFALLSSHQPNFGQALGEAGLYATTAFQKQRKEGRENYLAALKAGVDLQDKRTARDQKFAELNLSQNRLAQQEAERLRKEADTAQEKFSKIVSNSPAAKRQERLNALNQEIVAGGGTPVTDTKNLSPENRNWVDFEVKPAAERANANTQGLEDYASKIAERDKVTIDPSKPVLPQLNADQRVEVRRMAAGRGTPSDPATIKYMADQVQKDRANSALVPAIDKQAVEQELMRRGADVKTLTAAMRNKADPGLPELNQAGQNQMRETGVVGTQFDELIKKLEPYKNDNNPLTLLTPLAKYKMGMVSPEGELGNELSSLSLASIQGMMPFAAKSRNYQYIQDIAQHLPKMMGIPPDSPSNIYDKLLKARRNFLRMERNTLQWEQKKGTVNPPAPMLTPSQAKGYYRAAKGDPDLARSMAQEDGWAIPEQ